MASTLGRREALAVLGAVLGLAILVIPSIATDPPGDFRPGDVDASGPLAALVRATDGEWEVGIPRTAAVLAAMGVAVVIGAGCCCGAGGRGSSWRRCSAPWCCWCCRP